jgi:2-polyprenyl-6-methoxyphenol hydroxylase-like FAD-dependent oxidoreductase
MSQIVIIGAGFAVSRVICGIYYIDLLLQGMVLSLFLKRHGIEFKIYEYRDEAFTSGGNIALAPNALRVLDHIGLYDRIRTLGYNYDHVSIVNGHGSVLGRFLNGSQTHYNFQALRIHRTIVQDVLRAELQAQGIEIVYGKKCLGVINDDPSMRSVTVRFADGEEITASFVVGCDGIHSQIRKHVASDSGESQYSGLMGIMGTVMEEQVKSIDHGFSLPAMLFGNTGAFAIMPASFSGDEIGYFATLQVEDHDRKGWEDLMEDKKKLLNILHQSFVSPGGWPEFVTALCTETPPETLTSWP